MGKMDRTRAEFFTGLAVGLAAMIVPMTWWLRVGLLLVLSGIVADLIARSPLTARYHVALRAVAACLAVALIAFLSWKPISDEYTKEGGLTGLHDFIYSTTFALIVVAILGGLLGNQFAPTRPRLWRKAQPPSWPNVRDWLEPSEAIDKFTDPRLGAEFIAANERLKVVARELEEAEAARQHKPESELDALTRMTFRDPALSNEWNRKYQAEAVVNAARDRILEDLRRQLQDGVLAARAVQFEKDKLPTEWDYLQPPNWVVLSFDYADLKTAHGGGKVYKGLQIGKHGVPR
jgi:hypothetical protein